MGIKKILGGQFKNCQIGSCSLFFREIRHKVIGNYFQVIVPQAKYLFFWINQLHEHKIYGKINLQTIFWTIQNQVIHADAHLDIFTVSRIFFTIF